jgi:hypothetical protein
VEHFIEGFFKVFEILMTIFCVWGCLDFMQFHWRRHTQKLRDDIRVEEILKWGTITRYGELFEVKRMPESEWHESWFTEDVYTIYIHRHGAEDPICISERFLLRYYDDVPEYVKSPLWKLMNGGN